MFLKRLATDKPFIGDKGKEKAFKWEKMANEMQLISYNGVKIFHGVKVSTLQNRLKKFLALTEAWMEKDGEGESDSDDDSSDDSDSDSSDSEGERDNHGYTYTELAKKIKMYTKDVMKMHLQLTESQAEKKESDTAAKKKVAEQQEYFRKKSLNNLEATRDNALKKISAASIRNEQSGVMTNVLEQILEKQAIVSERRRQEKEQRRIADEQRRIADEQRRNQENQNTTILVAQAVTQTLVQQLAPLAEAIAKTFAEAMKK